MMGKRFFAFVFTFTALFGLTFIFLSAVDALPEPTLVTPIPESPSVKETGPSVIPEDPIRVTASKIKLDVTVENRTSTDLDVLNAALLKGAIRYPTSAQLGTKGTVVLLGHSTSLPIVRNQAYKAFNDIQELEEGDTINVYSDTREYRYRVTGVETANATVDTISMPQDGTYLKLVTCNTLGAKEDRFIVSAVFVGVYSQSL